MSSEAWEGFWMLLFIGVAVGLLFLASDCGGRRSRLRIECIKLKTVKECVELLP